MMGGLSSRAAGGDESTEVGSTVSGTFLSATFLVLNQAAAGQASNAEGGGSQRDSVAPDDAARPRSNADGAE